MGFFSDLAIDFLDDYEDNSYPSPERELLWRLDDLKERIDELTAEGFSYRNDDIYNESEIRYALPRHLDDICKVECAIELAKKDLLNKYGINVYAAESADYTEEIILEYDDGYEQINLFDVVLPDAAAKNKTAA